MGLILTILAVLGVVFVGARIAWHRSPEWRACRDAWSAARGVQTELSDLLAIPARAKATLEAEVDAYVTWQRQAARQALAVEELREYGARNVRWAGLQGAGIHNLEE